VTQATLLYKRSELEKATESRNTRRYFSLAHFARSDALSYLSPTPATHCPVEEYALQAAHAQHGVSRRQR